MQLISDLIKHIRLARKACLALVMIPLLFSACTFGKLLLRNRPDVNDIRYFCNKKIAPAVNAKNPFVLADTMLQMDEEWLKESATRALIVLRADTILYESYFNEGKKEEPEIIFSLTKAFVTSLLAISVEEGKMKRSDFVSKYLPEFKKHGLEAIQIEHLLQMTSGTQHNDYTNIFRTGTAYYNKNLDKYSARMKAKNKAGSEFAYKSMDTQLLGMCIEKAQGIEITDLLIEKLWEPLGMEYAACFTQDAKNGQERMYGGMAVTARDVLKLGRLYMNRGSWEGKQIIPKEWFLEIEQRKIVNEAKWWGYTNGVWLDEFKNYKGFNSRSYFMAGFGGQCMYIDPVNKIIVLRKGINNGGTMWHIWCSRFGKELNNEKIPELEAQTGKFSIDAKNYILVDEIKEKEWLFQLFKDGKRIKNKKMLPMDSYSIYDKKDFEMLIFTEQGVYFDGHENSLAFYPKPG